MSFDIEERQDTGPSCSESITTNSMSPPENIISVAYGGKKSCSIKLADIDRVKAVASAVNWVDHDFGSKWMGLFPFCEVFTRSKSLYEFSYLIELPKIRSFYEVRLPKIRSFYEVFKSVWHM